MEQEKGKEQRDYCYCTPQALLRRQHQKSHFPLWTLDPVLTTDASGADK